MPSGTGAGVSKVACSAWHGVQGPAATVMMRSVPGGAVNSLLLIPMPTVRKKSKLARWGWSGGCQDGADRGARSYLHIIFFKVGIADE